jgi:hypothetical protein
MTWSQEHELCWQHYVGVSYPTEPFYCAGCKTCEDKKARGLITGNEPPPLTRGKRHQTRKRTVSLRATKEAAIRRSGYVNE